MINNIVYLVHTIDAEGPLAEQPLSLNSGRRSRKDFFRRADFDEAADEEKFRELTRGHRQNCLDSWDAVLDMLRIATGKEQRFAMADSFGGGWIYNWFCLDHIGFVENPRRRLMGIHQVFDFYQAMVQEQRLGDATHWHFHPMNNYGVGNKCATSYLNSPHLYEILCRRVIERRWFPRANRAGFQDERPDSHWFLEQWIPFDFSNTSTCDLIPEDNPDLLDGRFSDWRWAPADWRTYHPEHDCHQREGKCRRKIARCLNLLNRFANLTEAELRRAFDRAREGKPTLVAMASHDFRDLNTEVDYVRHLLRRVYPDYPTVKFKYAEAVEAFNHVHPPHVTSPIKLACSLRMNQHGRPVRVTVKVVRGKVFGPQPFLAICTRSRNYIHDNMNYGKSLDDFNYQFDDESILPDDVKAIGIVANDAAGNQSLHTVDLWSQDGAQERDISF